MKSLKTFYDTLQVSRNANIATLRTAHKSWSEQLQPERNPADPGAAARQLLLVNKALEVLTHPHAREAYDAWLAERIGDAGVPTLPALTEVPNPSSGKAAVSAETLTPLPTLDLEGFAAELAAKAAASSSPASVGTAQPAKSAPAPLVKVPGAIPSAVAPPRAPKLPTTSTDSSGFAQTQPYHPDDADELPDLLMPRRDASQFAGSAAGGTGATASPRSVVSRSPALRALDWLRERPITLVGAVLMCVLLVAFAPWIWQAFFGLHKSEEMPTAPLQPTYVEPPAEAVSAPPVAAEAAVAVSEPSAEAPETKPTHKPKPRAVAKRHSEPKRKPEPVAPVQQPAPVEAPAPVDTGGHSGFAPKCRWVTPTNWSCK